MRLTSIFLLRLRTLFSRRTVEQELDEELRYHLERQIDEDVASGMSLGEARHAAVRAFESLQQRKEECRGMRGLNLIENLKQDLHFTFRQLRRNPGFACTAVFILALGLCTSAAIFAFVDAALIAPLPYRETSQLVAVFEQVSMIPQSPLSYADFLDWKRLNHVFQSLEAYKNTGFIVTTRSGSDPAHAARVSDGFFRTLGITPALGRDFYAGEGLPGAAKTVILSNRAWRQRYGGRTDVLGQAITLDGSPFVIIGVLPPDFHFAPAGPAEFWATLDANGSCESRRSCHDVYGVARLRSGVSVRAALANTVLIARELEAQYPGSNRGQGANVEPLSEAMVGDIRPILLVLLCGAGLLLLIACVNVASLLLVRAESRRREMSVRTALGASRIRLIRQFITEGLVLVSAGAVLGLISAGWAMQLLIRLIPEDMLSHMPFLYGIGLNVHVVAFACAIALLAAAVLAITPALHLSFTQMREGLAEGSRGSAGNTWRRLGARLVVVELATAMVLLVGAGLLGQSFYRLLHVGLGFQADHLATLMLEAPNTTYGKDPQMAALGRQVISRVSNLPGVKSAAIASRQLPVSFNGNTDWIRFVGRPYHGEHNEVNERDVSAGYFATIGAKLVRGRYFTDSEDLSKPRVAIINQTLARRYYPGEDPVGKQIADDGLSPASIRQIIGIVEDMREGPPDSEIWPAEYLPFNQSPDTGFALIVHTSQDEESLLRALTASIRQIDRGIVTLSAMSMQESIAESPQAYLHRSSAWLVGGFAAMALLLGVVGLYGVIAYSVSQRTREIGVRIALGAERSRVYRLILREAGWLALLGILAGVLCSLAATTLMSKLLFGIRSWDVPTLIAVAVVLAASALAASYIPAHRAASVDPTEALRAE